jgi:hypothetical protein
MKREEYSGTIPQKEHDAVSLKPAHAIPILEFESD